MLDELDKLEWKAEVSQGRLGSFFEVMRPFQELMMYYECAILEVRTKVEVLDREFSVRSQRDPVESIKTRLKSPLSIVEKLQRKGVPVRVDTIEQAVHDVAGIRIVCSFVDDIYTIARLLVSQDDITLLQVKDYIKNPKPNGYRSLHLLVGIPIFLSSGKKEVCVEVQIRTVAMDFWASTEHKIKYKKDVPDREAMTARLRVCAEKVAALDLEMQEIGREIARGTPTEDAAAGARTLEAAVQPGAMGMPASLGEGAAAGGADAAEEDDDREPFLRVPPPTFTG